MQKTLNEYQIDVTPDKSLFSKMGNSGHNFYESAAEFIDNSLDAMTVEQKAGHKKLRIDIRINAKKKFFSIEDNAKGMNRQIANDAAALGKSSKTKKDLGSFGVGLKSGATTIADNFIVETTMEGDNFATVIEYNETDWMKTNKWSLPAKEIMVNSSTHGTKIIINNVNKIKMTPQRTFLLKKDIGKRYGSFIKNGVDIRINGKKVAADEVIWADGYPIEFNVKTQFGDVTGIIGLMTESSQKGSYGFDMFRNCAIPLQCDRLT